MERELQQKKDRLDIFFSTLHSRGQFNGNVLIAEEGIPIFKESFGYSDIENKIELHIILCSIWVRLQNSSPRCVL